MKFIAVLATLVVFASPALSFETEEIGKIEATFDGQSIAQPTVIARDGEQADATAFLIIPGGGFSSLSLTGFSLDNKRLGIDAGFMSEDPGPQTALIDLTITYSPTGSGVHWTSENAPTPPVITFTTLEADAGKGRAAGSFSGVLCYAEGYETDADTENCHPISGMFDTVFMVE